MLIIDVSDWIKQVEEHASESVDKLLVGNKCDRDADRVSSSASNSIGA
jgi:GTPase SAR1 family protein